MTSFRSHDPFEKEFLVVFDILHSIEQEDKVSVMSIERSRLLTCGENKTDSLSVQSNITLESKQQEEASEVRVSQQIDF